MNETIKDFVHERITKNHLAIDVAKCLEVIEKYADIYPDISEIKRFFQFVLNTVGGILTDIDEDSSELFGSLAIRGKTGITFYEFVFDEDYAAWLVLRLKVYQEIKNVDDLRLLNYVELSTMNMITDIKSTGKYELIAKDGTVTTFNKSGYGTDQDSKSFIKFLGGKFKEGYSFKPVK